jgi:glucosamine--fructose-6-phosphate aminotransferase (isomerizing)
MALRFAQQLGTVPQAKLQELYQQLALIPDKITETLECEAAVKEQAKLIAKKPLVVFLGRNNCFPVALEAAIKLKEITYIPAEGYPAGEMKHGPIALISKGTPVFAIDTPGKQLREKLESNMQEIRARGGRAIVIGHSPLDNHSLEDFIKIPEVPSIFQPIISVIPFQLLAYYTAVELGRDVDMPRNLAKSVTVE